jgi:P4 family phage/plasmid primase-like protien
MTTQAKQNPPTLPELFPAGVSLFNNAFADEPKEQPALGDVLEAIRDGIWEEPVRLLRKRLERGDQKGYDNSKRSLPAFTMSTCLITRDKSVAIERRILSHSGILQADFDAKENPHLSDIGEVKRVLSEDPHVAFVFVSPSGRGVKAGVKIDPEQHRQSFFAAENHFLKKYGLQMDRSTKDPVRLCFVSHDPDIVINADAVEIEPAIEQRQQNHAQSGYSPVPLTTTAEDIREMLCYIPQRPEYSDWLRIASAVWSVLPMAEGCSVLAAWSPEEKPGEYADKHKHKLDEIGIGTLVWYAQQNGFDAHAAARRKIWAGRIRFAEPTMRDAVEDFAQDPAGEVGQVELTREFVVQCFEKKQLGDAQLWAHLARGRKLYDHLGQCWRTYRNGVWERDDMQRTLVELPEMLCQAYDELSKSIAEDIRQEPPENKKDKRTEALKELIARIGKIRSTGYLSGILAFAQSMLGTKSTHFDRSPEILCVKNGVIDFANGVFREHRHTDMVTHQTLCEFNPDAECPRWMRFLNYFMADDDAMIEYLARAAGYSLTGFVDKDVLFFCYGKGANGKSTYTSALHMLLGELMTTISIEALMAKASDNNFDYKKAQMEGKRLVVSDEIPESRKLNEAAIKSLVGGDPIAARRPYEKPYVFDPTHKLWLVGNHKPRIEGTDYGIWRRVHLIPWVRTMPEADRRPRHEVLSEFREELPGILNWAIRGYVDMVDNGGLRPPKQVVEATREYQSDSDQFARFLGERTSPSFGDSISLTDLRETYQAWCQDEGEQPRYQTNQKVSAYLRDQDYVIQRKGESKTRCVLGITLNKYE